MYVYIWVDRHKGPSAIHTLPLTECHYTRVFGHVLEKHASLWCVWHICPNVTIRACLVACASYRNVACLPPSLLQPPAACAVCAGPSGTQCWARGQCAGCGQ